ncbi:hypothetical protein DFH09DRAFT_1370590 [Mycena vulgaris]|nr:hypothetical protein DFH09DRAFT_1370590 [Mycena vulgaris]
MLSTNPSGQSRRAYDAALPSHAQHHPQPNLHIRHRLAGAYFGRHFPPSPSSFRPPWRAHSTQPPEPQRPAYQPIPGAGDRHHHHPGQRYVPPDPAAQAAAWAAQQRALRDSKRVPRLLGGVGGMVITIGTLLGLGWIMNKY